MNIALASEYPSLIDAIQASTTPRTYTLDANETSPTVLGDITGWNSVLTIDGGTGNYGINNTSTANDVRLFVNKNQTVYLQNLGTYTTTTSDTIVDGVSIITSVSVGNSVNNFGKNSDRVGFLRSAGTSHISNSVFYNNRAKFGGSLQNRENGTMSITNSVFVENTSPQGAVHNDGANKITQISGSIFYNNTAITQTTGDTDLINRSGSAIFNKPNRTIDLISGSQFVSNNTVSNATGQQTGTIYNGGTITEISDSVFYNNTNQRGSAINNISGSTINTISGTTFVQNTTSNGSGAAILNAIGSTIDTITGSNFDSNTVTSNGGAIYNEGEINTLSGSFKANSADSNGGAIYNEGTITDLGGTYISNSAVFGGALYNDGTITNAIDATFGGDNGTDGNSADLGGAIYNAEGKTLSVASTSIFKNNTAAFDGGAINNSGTINALAGTYTSNSADSNGGAIYNSGTINNFLGVYTSNTATTNGGALYNDGTITNAINATFGGDNIADGNSADLGGAIYNASGKTLSVASTSIFKNNAATDGGAIYNEGTINALAGTYTSNRANSNGGAIYNTGTISNLSGTFTSNTATTNGGAIYNTGTVTITSSEGADTTFSGNIVSGFSNALYNTGTVNMNAGMESSIVFNDQITGFNGTINIGGEGVVEFNRNVTGNSVALNSGTLKLGSVNSIKDATTFTANGGTLDLRNGGVHNYQLGQNTIINDTVDLAIDVNLSGTTPVADMITAAGTVSGTGSFVFSSANINIMSYADEKIPLWVQVTDENLRNYAGLGTNANIHITGSEPESYFITYETTHDSVNAGFLKFEHDTLWNAIASTVAEKAYTMGSDEDLTSTPALGGTSLTINGNEAGHSITGDTGTGIVVGDTQTLSLNNIGVDNEGNVSGAGLNNFDTAITVAANGTVNIYNTKFSGNSTDIDNDGIVNMSGNVIFDNAEGEGTINITKDSEGNASTITVNNSLEQDNINVESENSLTNDNATITVNTALNNAGAISGTGTSALVINGDSTNTGTIEQGTVTVASLITLANEGSITVNSVLDNTGSIIGDGSLNINVTTTNEGIIEQNILLTDNGITLTNSGDITVKDTLTNNGTIENNNDLTLSGTAMTNEGVITGTGTTNITGAVTNEGTISQTEVKISVGAELVSDASDITTTGGITNDGTLELTGGNITSDILSASGTTNITGEVTNNAAHSIANAIDIENSAKLTTNANALLNTVNNDGTLELTGGTVTEDISGNGSLGFTDSIQNSANIEQGSMTVNSGKTLTNNSGASITTTDSALGEGFQNNGTVLNDGTITVAGGNNTGSITGGGTFANNGDFTNSNTINQNAITNDGTLTTNSENLVATSGITNNGTLVYNAGSKTVSDIIGDGSANSKVELRTNAPFVIDNTISNTYVDLYNSTLKFGNSGNISSATALNINGGGINTIDGNISSTNLGTVNLNAQSNLEIDIDVSSLTSDSFNATVNNNGGIFNINEINLIGSATSENIKVHLGDMTGLGQENVTSETISLPSIMTPIRKINGSLKDGWLIYEGGSSSDVSDFNPAVLVTPVAMQAGMQAIMDNIFQYSYEHADWYTKFPETERYARLATGNAYKDNSAIWFKTYSTFEDIALKDGPKVDATSYGALIGFDTNFQDLGRDWYGVTTGFVGYNGAQMDYSDVNSSMNGGLVGLTQTFYKNNFWTGVSANAGVSSVEAHTMYGRDSLTILSAGIGTQTGYNFELSDGKFIIQPVWYMTYSMINPFDYTNAADVKIKSDPLHTLQLSPMVRFIGNVKGWQPYASVGMVFNLMNNTSVTADSIKLPKMHMKPYVQYDIGVQKKIGERFTGFLQFAGHNGGRDGLGVSAGLRWAFGKGGNSSQAIKINNYAENTAVTENSQEVQTEKPFIVTQEIDVKQEKGTGAESLANVEDINKKQQDVKTDKSVANTQKIDKKQQDAREEELVRDVQNVDKEQKDTKETDVKVQQSKNEQKSQAEESVKNAQNIDKGQTNTKTEEPATKTQENNRLAMAIVIGVALLFVIFVLRRKVGRK